MNQKKLWLLLLAVVLMLCVGCSGESGESPAADTVVSQQSPAETEIETAPPESSFVPEAGDATYILKFVDFKGRAVQGVVAKVCNADACVMAVSDERGLCELTLPAAVYEVMILNLPDGYEADGSVPYTISDTSGELVITLRRN